MIGSRISGGSCARTAEIASRTSCVAWSTGFSNTNCDDDLREAVGRRRVDLVDAADARELVLDAVDDLALDDVGRRTGIGDADEDDRRLDVGELVGLQPAASAAMPNTTSAIIVTTVMIGRLMAKSEMNTGFLLTPG